MNRFFEKRAASGTARVDAGLRAFMQRVFSMMGLGLAVTGVVAYFVANTPALAQAVLGTNLFWLLMIATIAIPLTLGAAIHRLSTTTASALFWTYATLMGLSLSGVFFAYTGESITRIFLISAALFGSMALYGYTTQRDLSAWGSFLFMGLMGVVLASVVNLFLGSSPLQMALSVVSVLVFTGLTAYDVQMLREFYHPNISEEGLTRISILGALRLYLDFINIFLSLLRLFGDRR